MSSSDAQRGVSPPGAESKRTGAKGCTAMLRRLRARRGRKTTGPDRAPQTRAAVARRARRPVGCRPRGQPVARCRLKPCERRTPVGERRNLETSTRKKSDIIVLLLVGGGGIVFVVIVRANGRRRERCVFFLREKRGWRMGKEDALGRWHAKGRRSWAGGADGTRSSAAGGRADGAQRRMSGGSMDEGGGTEQERGGRARGVTQKAKELRRDSERDAEERKREHGADHPEMQRAVGGPVRQMISIRMIIFHIE
ncbi:hypothetical protein C8J57DRAFT_1222283 [Mycena rebaudengoi]|nr:hypothetical protein C8J57DRAFT_1222283 [Mycena rebaudengoi]